MVAVCQRWRDGRDSYRPAGEPIDTKIHAVELLDEENAKAFVEQHHYSHQYVAARLRAGLFRKRAFEKERLVGVAVFSVPMNQHVVPRYLGVDPNAGAELGRFVLLDLVEANGETWFLRRAFHLLRQWKRGVRGIVSYSDPVPRLTLDGLEVKPGHLGGIYKAHNGRYVGRGRQRIVLVAPNGQTVCERMLSKLRLGERGRAYSYEDLTRMGAPPRQLRESAEGYVARVLTSGAFRKMKHPGNHVYLWDLAGAVLPPAKPRPTEIDQPRWVT